MGTRSPQGDSALCPSAQPMGYTHDSSRCQSADLEAVKESFLKSEIFLPSKRLLIQAFASQGSDQDQGRGREAILWILLLLLSNFPKLSTSSPHPHPSRKQT